MKTKMRVPFDDLAAGLERVLVKKGFEAGRASLSAKMFAEASLDGVYSHGLNRFPRYLAMIDNGAIDIEAQAVKVGGFAGVEQWDGHAGPGNLNAHQCMGRALELAGEHGLGAVALRNTNHWMRGGTYGWQAADAGCVGMCWTNTNQNLPPWGSSEAKIGNNPIIMSMPGEKAHMVLDMAMSQFSYGALEKYRKAEERLPVPGGFDREGNITDNPAEIEATTRPLPIGFWKGSALSIMLDVIAAALSGGNATHKISPDPLKETGLSQFFIAISVVTQKELADQIMDQVMTHLHAAIPIPGEKVYYPGERTLQRRQENLKEGIPVDEEIWQMVVAY